MLLVIVRMDCESIGGLDQCQGGSSWFRPLSGWI